MTRLVFAGSSDFAVPSLVALAQAGAGWEIAGVLSQPDRPAGRRRIPAATPVCTWAEANGYPVRKPLTLRAPTAIAEVAALRPDVLVVVDYGLLLPREVLGLPRYGCINGHASLLPRWRGAAPVQHAILAGDPETGVSIMLMDQGLDTGSVYKMQSTVIGETETSGELRLRLAELCAELLCETLPEIIAGTLEAEPQNSAGATYAGKLDAASAELDWREPAALLARRIRACAPKPGSWTRWRGQRLKFHRAVALAERGTNEAGRAWRTGAAGIDIAAGEGSVRVLELQAPGGRILTARDFLNGRPMLGERLGR